MAPVLELLKDRAFFGKIQACITPSLETLLTAVHGGGVKTKTYKKIVAVIDAISADDIEDSTAAIFLGVFKDQAQKVADKLEEMDSEGDWERLEAEKAAVIEEYTGKIDVLSKKFAAEKKKLVAEKDAQVASLQRTFDESHPVR